MRKRTFFLTIFIVFILQLTLLDSLKLFNIKPDLLLIITVIAALSFDLKWAVIFGVFAGLLKDIVSVQAVGINFLLFSLWSFLVIKLSRKILIENNLMRAALIFLVVLANAILSRAILVFFGNYEMPPGMFLRVAVLESIYASLIFPLLSTVLNPALSNY